jgi:hypothetical protein
MKFTKTTGGQQGTDFNAANKAIGLDMFYFRRTSANSANLNITLDTTGGLLYGTATISFSTGALSNGKVTGGTGSFTGATGTITGKAVSPPRNP